MENSISLFLCIYNLEVLTYNQTFDEKSYYFSVISQLAQLPLIEPENARDWVEAGSNVIQSTQTL